MNRTRPKRSVMVHEPSPLVRPCLKSAFVTAEFVARDHSTQHIAVAQSTMVTDRMMVGGGPC